MREPTKDGYTTLTEREKATLRLLLAGHDAKSAARYLGLSVHTVNERLRDARRKLSVSSSREAARLLLDREGALPENVVDTIIGEAASAASADRRDWPNGGLGRKHRPSLIRSGTTVMTLALGFLAFAALSQPASDPTGAAAGADASAEAANASVTAAAQAWLALVDQSRWNESWAATGTSFRKLNTSKTWAVVSEQVRAPLGAVRPRVLLSQDSVPAPPNGVQVLKFKTSFANKPETIETVSLAQEEGLLHQLTRDGGAPRSVNTYAVRR